jgi:uncharacterized protein YciI
MKYLAILGALALAGVAAADPHQEHAMHPIETYTVTYSAGPQWKPDQPMEKQDLAGHLEFVKTQLDRHTLVANGHLTSGKGFYVFRMADPKALAALVAHDPGVDAGVLQIDVVEAWTLAFEKLDGPARGPLFVLDYRPGPKWRHGKSLVEQDLGKHLDYVASSLAAGTVLAGGPVDAHHGRYIVTAPDRAAVDAWVKHDPAVTAEVVRVEVTGWEVFNRRSPR